MRLDPGGDIGAIIIGHGSRAEEAAATMKLVGEMVGRSFSLPLRLASLQFNRPNIADAVSSLVNEGKTKIIIVPFFLLPGNHVSLDLPEMIEIEKNKYNGVDFIVTDQLGADPRLVSLVVSRISEAVDVAGGSNGGPIHHPSDIQAESFNIIEGYIPSLSENSGENEVVKRIVHATGDIAVAPQVRFSPGAVAAATAAIREGSPIVTDVNMVRVGISRSAIERFKNEVICLIDNEEIAEEAKLKGKTRSAVAIDKAALDNPNAVFVIGNAPSALQSLGDLIDAGKVEPAAVIGVPVGFVGAAESKDRLAKKDIPWITIIGSRGGSAAAAAAINAIAIIAAEK